VKYVRITPCCHVVDVAIMVAYLCIVYNQRFASGGRCPHRCGKQVCSGSFALGDVSCQSRRDHALERICWRDRDCKRGFGSVVPIRYLPGMQPVICDAVVPPTIPSFIRHDLQCSYLGSSVYSKGLTDCRALYRNSTYRPGAG
jgi:hypothetical protein